MNRLLAPLFRFLRREDGAVLIEGVIMLPMLLWTTFGLFVFWDAHKEINLVQKATYTVADAISRRQLPADCPYLEGMHDVMNYMLVGDEIARMRMTSVTYDLDNDKYVVLWSYSPDAGMAVLTTAALAAIRDRLPVMSDGDTVVLVETEKDYQPAFDVGLNDLTIRQFIFTRPRLAPRVDFTC